MLSQRHPQGSHCNQTSVKNLENGKTVEVRVIDKGPFIRGRIIELSERAAIRLDMIGKETVPVEITLISTPDQPRTRTAATTRQPAVVPEPTPTPTTAARTPSLPPTTTPAPAAAPQHRPRSRRRKTGLDLLIRSTVADEDRSPRGGNTADTKRVTLIFNKQHLAELKEQAKERGMYLKDVVQEMVSNYLEK